MSLRKLEPSPQRMIKGHQIALKQGNQNPQNSMIASFASTGKYNSIQWSNYLPQWAAGDFDSRIKFNASTGKEYCE